MKLKILGITLARGGSKGIKNKNIKLINNKPLIAHTIIEAKKSSYLNEYVVSTDSKKIAAISKKFGAEVPFLRPKKLSTDKASSVDALIHATKFMERKNKVKNDFVVELMCTNPLKKVSDIDQIIKKIIAKKADSVIALHRIYDHHPARVKKVINGKIVNFCINEKAESRRQDLKPNAYVRSGSIYALNRDYLVFKKRRYGSKKSYAYILPNERAINIDGVLDFYLAEKILSKKKNEKKV